MRILKGLFWIGLGTAGVYFLDPGEGRNRRRRAGEQVRQVFERTRGLGVEYSRDFRNKTNGLLDSLKTRGADATRGAGSVATDLVRSGASHLSAPGQLMGALGGAFAIYGAGRRGTAGTLLRTISLGLFTQALLRKREAAL